MPFYLSPLVNVIEKDFGLFIPAVSTSIGGSVGNFAWGPIDEIITVSHEQDIVVKFGKPNDRNYKDWFSAANFLAYTDALRLVRTANITGAGDVTPTFAASTRYSTGTVLNSEVANGYRIKVKDTVSVVIGTATVSGGTTVTVDTVTPHGSQVGDTVVVSGITTPAGLNGTFTVTGTPDLDTVVYELSGSVADGPAVLGVTPTIKSSTGTSGATITPTPSLSGTAVSGTLLFETVGFWNGRPNNASDVNNFGDAESFRLVGNTTAFDLLFGTKGTSMSANVLAKYPGELGNRISVAYRDGKTHAVPAWSAGTSYLSGDLVRKVVIGSDLYRFEAQGNGISGVGEPVWPSASGATVVDGTVTWKNSGPIDSLGNVTWSMWEYSTLFSFTPTQISGSKDEFAFVVFLDGVVVESGVVDAIQGRKDDQNQPNYVEDFLARFSKYIYINAEKLFDTFVTGTSNVYSKNLGDTLVTLNGGLDGDAVGNDDYISSWTKNFADADQVDVNLIFAGGALGDTQRHIVENIASIRKDCLAFISPHREDVVNSLSPVTNMTDRVNGSGVNHLNLGSSYAFMDGNYKYQYDLYNDKFRWVPLNGDMAGLAAATDQVADPWWSFAGYNRGQIKNVVKLAFNPTRAQRDDLYVNSINPVIQTRGEGPILFGDRTTLRRPSPFRSANVRRLFIVLEKAISTAAKYQLFEFNDEDTQQAFVSAVVPFLRDVQGRRGIQADRPGKPGFLVVADSRVNTDEVIDRQEFKGLILIRPARSINFIELTFAATKSGTIFEELLPDAVSQI